mmetsp:Transcript_20595/g.60153  ORF Transcript_20595/g.60153 Transcript_20595/m.60153 type:complete len:87 (-) Transcript_20595:228-488(-)|eukprot:CAMPEP_0118972408 /NCGR_PEP_ID=MMETSP1173-20130426/8717_1 /TAXON_ID=1034831 /ORGANISM="Rhizochromulina marina cf, Strain CCMP1243" /LENGTH=86 /DNA_ID=CAMNT_0006921945 /DNA_START=86 /DNA_END=346 /DNA_ORIENTATION=-
MATKGQNSHRPETFDDFEFHVRQLCEASPDKIRLVTKYVHKKGEMHVRATDDTTSVVFRTNQAADLRRVEALSLWLCTQACGGDED